MRMVPLTKRAANRLASPRGVSARSWAAAGPVERATFWHERAKAYDHQAKAGGPLVYAFAAEAARYRATMTMVHAAEAYLQATSPRTQQSVVDGLYRGLDTGTLTPPQVVTMLESGWLRTREQSHLAVDRFADLNGSDWTQAQRDEVVDGLRLLAALGWRAPAGEVVVGSQYLPGDRDQLGAVLDEGLRETDQISRLADRTGLTVDQVVDLLRVAQLRLQAGAVAPRPGRETVETPRLDRLQKIELQVLVGFGTGQSLEHLAAELELRPAEVDRLLGQAVDKLGRDGGRMPVTEAGTRTDAVEQFVITGRSGWWQVRNRLREVEARLDPAERDALWNAADRIEEWIERLSPPRRAQAYRELLAAGVVSVRELATTSDAELAVAGLSPATIAAVRSVLPSGDPSTQAAVRWLAQSLEWTEAHLTAALELLIDDTRPAGRGGMPADLPGLLRAAEVADAAALLDHAGDASTVAAALLARARRGELSWNELAVLVRHALGRGLSDKTDRALAIAVLHEHLRARGGPDLAADTAASESGPVANPANRRGPSLSDEAIRQSNRRAVVAGLGLLAAAGAGAGGFAVLGWSAGLTAAFGVGAVAAVAVVVGLIQMARARGPPSGLISTVTAFMLVTTVLGEAGLGAAAMFPAAAGVLLGGAVIALAPKVWRGKSTSASGAGSSSTAPDATRGTAAGPLGLLTEEEIARAHEAFAAVRTMQAGVRRPGGPADAERLPQLRLGEEWFSADSGRARRAASASRGVAAAD